MKRCTGSLRSPKYETRLRQWRRESGRGVDLDSRAAQMSGLLRGMVFIILPTFSGVPIVNFMIIFYKLCVNSQV